MPSNSADFAGDIGAIKAKLDSALVGVRIAEKMASDATLALEQLLQTSLAATQRQQLYALPMPGPSVHGEPARLYCRVREAAKMTGLSERTIYRLIDDGTLETVKRGKARLIKILSLNCLADGKVPA
jgi:excisionase family DNA binding protein